MVSNRSGGGNDLRSSFERSMEYDVGASGLDKLREEHDNF
jgi:hypothetical protein